MDFASITAHTPGSNPRKQVPLFCFTEMEKLAGAMHLLRVRARIQSQPYPRVHALDRFAPLPLGTTDYHSELVKG